MLLVKSEIVDNKSTNLVGLIILVSMETFVLAFLQLFKSHIGKTKGWAIFSSGAIEIKLLLFLAQSQSACKSLLEIKG